MVLVVIVVMAVESSKLQSGKDDFSEFVGLLPGLSLMTLTGPATTTGSSATVASDCSCISL